MITDKIRNRIAEGVTLLEFVYNGKAGNIDPYYTPSKGPSYLLYFDGNEQLVYSLDEVMNTPFIDGKSLIEAADEVTVTDW